MNPRQPTKTPRNLRRHETPSSLPPVLFSLPNLSETTTATPVAPKPEPIATVSTRLPLVSPPNDSPQARRDERQKEKSASLLNAAIGFLALAMMLIGAKIYSDRASESSRAAQRTNRTNNADNSVSPPPQTASTFQANPERGIPERGIPERGIITNVGPQRASYQVPLIPQPNRSVSESDPSKPQADPSDKPTLEISEPLSYQPLSPLNYQPEANHGPIQQAQFQSEALPLDPLPIASLPVASLPVASLPVASLPNGSALGPALGPGAAPKTASSQTGPPAAFTPSVQNAIPAASLNTRDMIRLRQGKPVEMTNREPGSPSSVQLSGETYPPVRQKYQPLSLPQPQTLPTNSYNGEFLPRSPTSMEIPPPPTPYQPIGTEPTQ
jgi:hypothetical protein